MLCVTSEEIGERDNLLFVGCVLMYPTKPENKAFNLNKTKKQKQRHWKLHITEYVKCACNYKVKHLRFWSKILKNQK